MNFGKDLRQSAKTASSAYLQFITGRGREGFLAYAFVEDDDDIAFYQHALTNIPDICFLGCGGKSNVRDVFLKTSSDGTDIGNLFFVDRDTEEEPFEFPDAILRTDSYSWENHACEPKMVKRLLKRKLNPSLPIIVSNRIEQQWIETVGTFADILNMQLNLIWLCARTYTSLGSSRVMLAEEAIMVDNVLTPSLAPSAKLDEIIIQIRTAGIQPDKIDEALGRDARHKILKMAHGKSLFRILRVFLSTILSDLGRVYRINYNSPLNLVLDAPWDDESFDYIRSYAESRLAKL